MFSAARRIVAAVDRLLDRVDFKIGFLAITIGSWALVIAIGFGAMMLL